jgi:2-keto-4-pentenoate hydratase/2-oxohepta-3-ene-1,7-dioic acid hydratase in catechol pathway
VAGYCVVNDVSERAYQPERGGTWNKGQGCDSVGPVGPWLVTADEVPDPQTLDLCLDLNGQPMQRGNIRTMVFGVAALVSSVSRYMTLYPGDRLRLGMQGLGAQRQTVRARDRALSDDLAGTPT